MARPTQEGADEQAVALMRVLDELPPSPAEPASAFREDGHLGDLTVALYLARELDEATIEAVEAHLTRCPECLDLAVVAAKVEAEAAPEAALALGATHTASSSDAHASIRRGEAALPRRAARERDVYESSNRRDRAASAPRPKRWRRRIFASLAVAAGLLLVIGATATGLLLRQLTPLLANRLSAAADRPVTLSSASLVFEGNPSLRLTGLSIDDDPRFSSSRLFKVDVADLKVDPISILRGRLSGEVHLERPELNLVRDPLGRWNIETLGGREPAPDVDEALAARAREKLGNQPDAGQGPGKDPAVRLVSASIVDATLSVTDRSGKGGPGSDLTLEGVDLSYVAPDPAGAGLLTLDGRVKQGGGTIALHGEIGPFEGSRPPIYRFNDVKLKSVPVAELPGAPRSVTGDLTFAGTLEGSGSSLLGIVANATGAGSLGMCCGQVDGRNLGRDIVATLGSELSDEIGAELLRAAQSSAMASALAGSATPFANIAAKVALGAGALRFEDLGLESRAFKANATGSLTVGGDLSATGQLTLAPELAAALRSVAPKLSILMQGNQAVAIPFEIAGTWPEVRLSFDVARMIARAAEEIDPRRFVLWPAARVHYAALPRPNLPPA